MDEGRTRAAVETALRSTGQGAIELALMALNFAYGEAKPQQYAQVAGEALRLMNHHLGLLHAAADVYDMVAALAYCEERMPQAIEGLDRWLADQLAAGTLRLDNGSDVAACVTVVQDALEEARGAVDAAGSMFRRAHNGMAPVAGPLRRTTYTILIPLARDEVLYRPAAVAMPGEPTHIELFADDPDTQRLLKAGVIRAEADDGAGEDGA